MASKFFVFRFADIKVREREYAVVRAGAVSPVEPKAFRVLLILLRNPQKLIPKEELLNAVWGDAAVTENSLTRAIALLRKILGDDTRKPHYIETVATVGYRFLCPVEATEDGFRASAITGKSETVAEELVASSAETERSTAHSAPGSSGVAAQIRTESKTRRRLWTWILAGGVTVGALVWFLTRPLPRLHVTDYKKLTNDGSAKTVTGTDGSRLYLIMGSPVSNGQMGVTGGKIAPMPVVVNGTNGIVLDVSPDGSSLLIGASPEETHLGELWSDRVMGGAPRRLGIGTSGAFSPDGKTVVYGGVDDIWLVNSDGTGARKLASAIGEITDIAWSPAGKLIRFTRNARIEEIKSDGSGLRQLLPSWHTTEKQCCGHWTPDGHFFMFVTGSSPRSGSGGGQIWALDERHDRFRKPGADPFQLTTGPIQWGSLTPSKDGKQIFANGATPRGELLRYDVQTKQWQPYLGGISACCLALSPDGKSMTYTTVPEFELWRANRDGSDAIQLTDRSMKAVNPRWSPDGTRLLFTEFNLGPGFASIYVLSADGGRPEPLFADSQPRSDANWSPDGSKIVYSADLAGDPLKSELRTFDLASHHETPLPDSRGMWSPRWSSNGRYVAALSWKMPNIGVFDLQENRWSRIPDSSGSFWPAFSKDGRYLYFLRFMKDDQGVFRSRVPDGRPELVVSLKGWKLTIGGGFYASLDPTDAPLVLRDVGTDDIYALTLEEK